jgi:hypothetical protein
VDFDPQNGMFIISCEFNDGHWRKWFAQRIVFFNSCKLSQRDVEVFPEILLSKARSSLIPSGKHTKNDGKSPCLMGKSPFLMGKSPFFHGIHGVNPIKTSSETWRLGEPGSRSTANPGGSRSATLGRRISDVGQWAISSVVFINLYIYIYLSISIYLYSIYLYIYVYVYVYICYIYHVHMICRCLGVSENGIQVTLSNWG